MKNIGIVRKVDDLGRVTLVKEDRKILRINENDQVVMVRRGHEIIIKKFHETCIICSNDVNENEFLQIGDKRICKNCINKIVKKQIFIK